MRPCSVDHALHLLSKRPAAKEKCHDKRMREANLCPVYDAIPNTFDEGEQLGIFGVENDSVNGFQEGILRGQVSWWTCITAPGRQTVSEEDMAEVVASFLSLSLALTRGILMRSEKRMPAISKARERREVVPQARLGFGRGGVFVYRERRFRE